MLSIKMAENLISLTKSTLRVLPFSFMTHRKKESETVPISTVYLVPYSEKAGDSFEIK